jgi:sulfofructose kinase
LSLQSNNEDARPVRPFDILAIGGIDLDLVMEVERLPNHGEKILCELVGRLPGGSVANLACAAARLGMRVASLSTVGQDEAGQMIIDDFENYGVDTGYVLVRPDIDTPFTVILIEPSGERSIIVVPTFWEDYDANFLQTALSQTKAMHSIPNDPALFKKIAKIARTEGVLVMIDVDTTIVADRKMLERILHWVDVASFNERALVSISGEEASVAGARQLLQYGPHTVVVTLGERGALAVTSKESAEVTAWKVPIKDTTGAGDTFNAAFLTATLRGYSLERCLAFANGAAALAVTGLGARGRLPTSSEVEDFMMRGNRGSQRPD